MSLETCLPTQDIMYGRTGQSVRLQESLSLGDLSTVRRGFDDEGRQVAVKIYHTTDVDPSVRDYRMNRAVSEAAITTRATDIAPDGVVPLERVDIDALTGRPFLVSRYISGGALGDKKNGDVSSVDTVALMAGVAQSVGVLNKHGIIHRDIKPENILVDTENEKGTPTGRLADFAIAVNASIGDVITQEGRLLGTPRYLSPESMRGRGDIPPVDVWSLGVTTFTLLEGKNPYSMLNTGDLVALYLTMMNNTPLIRDVFGRPILDKGLRETVSAAMCKDPERRLSATEFGDRLSELAEKAKKANVEMPLATLPTTKRMNDEDRTQGGVPVLVFENKS
jgi:eukaryotic-like serine/threonine-protein kinase